MFTDVANGVNLYMGPEPNAAVNERAIIDDGRIREPHPVWGVMMLLIPFLPMMVVAPLFAIVYTMEEGYGSCTLLGVVLLAMALSFPFTAVATPIYVLYVCGVGIIRVIAPEKLGKDYKKLHGMLKTAEISLESAIQTCLGEFQPPSTL